MKRNGVEWIRLPVYWYEVEPREGDFRFEKLDSMVGAASAAGLEVMPVVLGTPDWAAEPPFGLDAHPSSPTTYGRFLSVLADRYGKDGSFWQGDMRPAVPVRRWQIWNEPDLPKYWRRDANGWAQSYVKLLRESHDQLRSSDRSAIVVLAGLSNFSWRSLRKIYRAGGRRVFDVAAFHPFTARVEGVIEIIRRSRAVMRRSGDSSKPLMVSEVSWSSGKGLATLNYGWETTEQGQARRVAEVITALAERRSAYGIQSFAWATWLSPEIGSPYSFDYSGLNRMSTGVPVAKPALSSYRKSMMRVARRH